MLLTHKPTHVFQFFCDNNESALRILNAKLKGDELLDYMIDGRDALYDEERMQAIYLAVQKGLVDDPQCTRLVTY
ncbi:hypothetical protein AB4137_02935 [Vibrio breoganii]